MNKKDNDINDTEASSKNGTQGEGFYYTIIYGIIAAFLTALLGIEIISQICEAKYGPPGKSFDKKILKNPDGTDVKNKERKLIRN